MEASGGKIAIFHFWLCFTNIFVIFQILRLALYSEMSACNNLSLWYHESYVRRDMSCVVDGGGTDRMYVDRYFKSLFGPSLEFTLMLGCTERGYPLTSH